MISTIIIATFLLIVIFLFLQQIYNNRWKTPKKDTPLHWTPLLLEHVPFYENLSESKRKHFEYKIQEFLLNTTISGVKTEVTELDEILIASSAIIPIFSFKDWKYQNLTEILLYPNAFNQNFDLTGPDRRILGMVGSGFMEGKMILSKEALHHGFKNETDKHNTAIHEFIHIIDKEDGEIDGIPAVLLEKQYVLPWMQMVLEKITEIRKKQHKDINPYGATNQAEFFAVIGTYFFERPKLLRRKHPELYKLLCEIFDTPTNQ
ncbi:MAG: zinc-dependent peptidase [Flavobacteriales bacterium]